MPSACLQVARVVVALALATLEQCVCLTVTEGRSASGNLFLGSLLRVHADPLHNE